MFSCRLGEIHTSNVCVGSDVKKTLDDVVILQVYIFKLSAESQEVSCKIINDSSAYSG